MHKYGFDQWGVLRGAVIQNEHESELYFRGLRERILKPSPVQESRQKTWITGISENGFHFVISQEYFDFSSSM